jgi:hypothetical protein
MAIEVGSPAVGQSENSVDHVASGIFDILDENLNILGDDADTDRKSPAKKAPAKKSARKNAQVDDRSSNDEGGSKNAADGDEGDAANEADDDPYAAFDDSDEHQPGKGKKAKGKPSAEDAGNEAADDDEQTDEDEDVDGDDETSKADDSIRFKWKTRAGEDFDLSLGDLKSGFMRQTDYTAKTQDLSATRQALTKAVEGAAVEHKTRFESLDGLMAGLTELAVGKIEPPDPKLIETDMEAYQAAKAHYDLQESTWKDVASKIANMKADDQKKAAEAFEVFKRSERAKLPAAIQILGDPKRGLQVWKAMHQELRDRGKSDQEIAGVATVADWQMVHDAMMYRLSRKASENTQDRVRKAPRHQRSGRGRSKREGSSTRMAKSRSRAIQTGNMDDHALAILDVMPEL